MKNINWAVIKEALPNWDDLYSALLFSLALVLVFAGSIMIPLCSGLSGHQLVLSIIMVLTVPIGLSILVIPFIVNLLFGTNHSFSYETCGEREERIERRQRVKEELRKLFKFNM